MKNDNQCKNKAAFSKDNDKIIQVARAGIRNSMEKLQLSSKVVSGFLLIATVVIITDENDFSIMSLKLNSKYIFVCILLIGFYFQLSFRYFFNLLRFHLSKLEGDELLAAVYDMATWPWIANPFSYGQDANLFLSAIAKANFTFLISASSWSIIAVALLIGKTGNKFSMLSYILAGIIFIPLYFLNTGKDSPSNLLIQIREHCQLGDKRIDRMFFAIAGLLGIFYFTLLIVCVLIK